MYQDTHIHIQDIKNASAIDGFIALNHQSDIIRFFDCAITPADWPVIKSLAETYNQIVPFFGFHPWFADLADEKSFKKLEEYLAWPKARLGEMGLDKARKNVDFGLQKDVFSHQLTLAAKFRKPFAVHCVRAWGEVIGLIKTIAPGLPFLLHSFNGSRENAQEAVKLGGFFSISVKQFQKPEGEFPKDFQMMPADRILLETDFPYQVKWTNPPDYIQALRQAYETAASWRGVNLSDFMKTIYENGTIFAD